MVLHKINVWDVNRISTLRMVVVLKTVLKELLWVMENVSITISAFHLVSHVQVCPTFVWHVLKTYLLWVWRMELVFLTKLILVQLDFMLILKRRNVDSAQHHVKNVSLKKAFVLTVGISTNQTWSIGLILPAYHHVQMELMKIQSWTNVQFAILFA